MDTAFKFQSTLPVRGGTLSLLAVLLHQYFNPFSPCREIPSGSFRIRRLGHFNPLSPCGEILLPPGLVTVSDNISIHSPQAGRYKHSLHILYAPFKISIHSPRAGRYICEVLLLSVILISIHSPRAGRYAASIMRMQKKIISIHPPHAGRSPIVMVAAKKPSAISIHSPHAGRYLWEGHRRRKVISIHSPHEGRY